MILEFAKLLKQADNIVFLGGAGVSTESGIPDFRSAGGRYNQKREDGLSLEETLGHRFFMAHPEEFYQGYRNSLVHENAKPNDAHYALAKLEQMGKLRAVITQNVDGLHQEAGSKNVLELHGSRKRNYCMVCKKQYGSDYLIDPANCREAADGGPGVVPLCSVCGGIVRPDIVLYEESLDQKVLQAALQAVMAADLMIVGGTSLVVYPAAGLVDYFGGDKLVLINRTETPFDERADLVFRSSIGKVLSEAVASL